MTSALTNSPPGCARSKRASRCGCLRFPATRVIGAKRVIEGSRSRGIRAIGANPGNRSKESPASPANRSGAIKATKGSQARLEKRPQTARMELRANAGRVALPDLSDPCRITAGRALSFSSSRLRAASGANSRICAALRVGAAPVAVVAAVPARRPLSTRGSRVDGPKGC